jgi:hypothetical protein
MTIKNSGADPVLKLAMDFKRWGVDAIKRVRSMTYRYGVCFDWYFETGKG